MAMIFNPVDLRSRNTGSGTAVFVNIPRDQCIGFTALELFPRDRDTGLFPGMGTYCPGLIGSKGLNVMILAAVDGY